MSLNLIPPPSRTFALPHEVMFDVVTDTFTFDVDMVERIEEVFVVEVMEEKFEEVKESVFDVVPPKMMSGWDECIVFHCTPSN